MQLKPKIFMEVALGFLILSLLDGIFRLMSDDGLPTGVLQNIYGLHPILMIFGFLATIVMTERIAGVAIIPEMKRSNVPMVMVPLIVFGVLLETFGYTVGPLWSRYFGASFLLVGCLVFMSLLLRLSSKSGVKLPFYFMIISGVSLSVAAILSAFSLPADNFSSIMLLLSFPVVFILGERVELTRFTSSRLTANRFRLAFGLVTCSTVLFAFSSALGPALFKIQMAFLSTGAALLLITFLAVLSAESRSFKMLSKSREPLQRYVISHTRVAYAWGILGVFLGVVYFGDLARVDLYDAVVHSIAVGFVGTMLLAHGPVILPTVTGKKLDLAKISFLPLVILTLANLIRVCGDVVLLFFYSFNLRVIIGLSGWLVLFSVVVFLREILRGVPTRMTVNAADAPYCPK